MQDFKEKIQQLKNERNAVILAHYYQRGEIQDIADFVGDSLGLSRQAANTNADVIVFCGVHFMAETAKILSPQKTVLTPDPNAGCPMADMVTPRELHLFKQKYPGAKTVAYVNSSAETKAHVDICCTSSNAVKVVESLPSDVPVLFVPDKNLGDYVRRQTGRNIITWDGYCPTHQRFLLKDVKEMKALHPDAILCVHPECTHDVIQSADFVGSTAQILSYCKKSDTKSFIIGSEIGMLYTLEKQNPDKVFYALSPLGDCPDMKLTTLQKVCWALEDMQYEVTLDENIRTAAYASVDKMIHIG